MDTKEEPTYEINYEKLSSLSIADLTGLLLLVSGGESYLSTDQCIAILHVSSQELNKRINDIIIF